MSPSRDSAVLQLVHANHAQAEAGHKRLRTDWREHDEQITELQHSQRQLEAKLSALIATPPDLSKTRLSAGTVATILFAVVGIIAGQLASTWGIKSDVRDITTHMTEQQRLQDERANAQRTATESIAKKQELLQLKFDELRDQVLTQQRKAR